jgi:hypothetical protein
MKPGEGLAQVLSKDEKLLGAGKLPIAGGSASLRRASLSEAINFIKVGFLEENPIPAK